MQLYGYYRSSASYRVRIALGLKGLPVQLVPVNLLAAAHRQEDYLAINPQGAVPALVAGGQVFAQSLAIMEYVEEMHPEPPLLPVAPSARARVRRMAQIIACDISPLGNRVVLQYLEHTLKQPEEARLQWIRHWVGNGFRALESLLQSADTGRFCHGDAPTLADCCLVPQVYNARRFGCDLSPYPAILRIDGNCAGLPAFQAAHPDSQPDAPQ